MENFEENIEVQDYVLLNEQYIQKQKELEEKIKKELSENSSEYPAGAEELYFFEYDKELTYDEENTLIIVDELLSEKFRNEQNEINELREKIVKMVGHIVENHKENSSEN